VELKQFYAMKNNFNIYSNCCLF